MMGLVRVANEKFEISHLSVEFLVGIGLLVRR